MTNQGKIVELDVREHLRNKWDPFKLIMDHVKELSKDDQFRLHTTFKPTPLLKVMRLKGYVNKAEKLAADHWLVTFVHKSRRDLLNITEDGAALDTEGAETDAEREPEVFELDNRGLEPPHPMVRTLSKLEEARPGDRVIIHNDRVPVFLIEELSTLGYTYVIEEQPDGSAIVQITKH
ncbi:hypothetical protein PRECH8_20530 [Insulibacter thermoxylanivorax]|uniref:DUF2249 domain-containing protein n=1 Tax=Insulibacter thermoxylanivorax TaxID=2749268 RepID=A0A916QI19_9BACL|nr:DUF2249 domain-containing protein [Insulibacter thermoxylanivorax]GFR38757.1 hypothetical protein PRECH8_20530 [Insulibacter thermoxylanivorax]